MKTKKTLPRTKRTPKKTAAAMTPAPAPRIIPAHDPSWLPLALARSQLITSSDTCEVIAASLPKLGTRGGTLALEAAAKLLRREAGGLRAQAVDLTERIAVLNAEYKAKHGIEWGGQ